MKKSFMTRALAMGLSLAMAFSLSAATNVSVASAATAKPAMKSKSISVKVGQTKNYNATDATKKNYAIKNVKLSAAGKKAASVTWTAGKITVTGKAADSTKRNVKITFKNRKTKKNYYVTLKLVVKAAPEEEVKPVEPATKAAIITGAKQTEATKIAAEFSADMTGIKYTDLKIVRDETKAVVTVKSATVDKNDNTKVAIETYEALKDGKTYTVTYTSTDESKTETNATFTATAGVVDSIALNTYSIPANTATTIKYQLLDANGVLIEQKGIGDTHKSSNIEVSMENFNGYQKNSEVTLYKIGDTAKIKVVYHTYKYNTDATEQGKVEKEFEITAVDPSNVIETYDYSVVMKQSTQVDFKRDTLVHQIAIDDDDPTGNSPCVKFSFRKADGTDITKDLDYTVSSGNENVLLANGYVADDGVLLTPVATGSTYLMIKNAAGAVITTLPINVVAKRELASMTVAPSSVTVSQYTNGVGTQKIVVSAMDQYSSGYGNYTVGDPVLRSNNDDDDLHVDAAQPVGNKSTITITATGATPGTYAYTMDLTDGGKTTNNVKRVSFTVTVSKELDKPTFALVMMNEAKDSVVSSVDTTVGAGTFKDIVLKPTIVVKDNGSIKGEVTTGSGMDVQSIKNVTLKKSGTAVGNDPMIYNSAAENADEMWIEVAAKNGAGVIVKNLEPGTYTLSLVAKLKSGVEQNMSTSFQVTDSQKVFEAKVNDEKIPAGITTLAEVFNSIDPEYVTFYYASQSLNHVVCTYDHADYTKNNSGQLNVKKVYMNVVVPGTNNQMVRLSAPVNRTFTFAYKNPTGTSDSATVEANVAAFNTTYKAADYITAGVVTATPAQEVEVISEAAVVIRQYNALSASEKANMKNEAAKIIDLARTLAADVIVDNNLTSSGVDVEDVLDVLGITGYDEADLEVYRTLIDGATWTTTELRSARLMATESKLTVNEVIDKVVAIINAVYDAKAAVLDEAKNIEAALLTKTADMKVVTAADINDVTPATIDFAVASVSAGNEIVVTNATATDNGYVKVSASAVTGTSKVIISTSGSALTAKAHDVTVKITYKAYKEVIKGATITASAVSATKAAIEDNIKEVKKVVTLTNSKDGKWIVKDIKDDTV